MKKITLVLDLEIRMTTDGSYEYITDFLCVRPLCFQCYYSFTTDEETEMQSEHRASKC